jgi:hypothetical protein
MSPFDFLNAINDTKQNLFEDPQAEKDYNAFLINRGLSYFPDTIFYANEMNKQFDTPKKMQFDFLMNSIPKRKRFSKWHKKDVQSDRLKLIQDYYKYNEERALEALSILSDEKITIIENKMNKGGRNDH